MNVDPKIHNTITHLLVHSIIGATDNTERDAAAKADITQFETTQLAASLFLSV